MGVSLEDIKAVEFGIIIALFLIFFLFEYPDPAIHLSIPHSSITGRHLERERAFRESADYWAFCEKWRRRLLLLFLPTPIALAVAYIIIPINDGKRFWYVTGIVCFITHIPYIVAHQRLPSEFENLARKHGLSEWQ